MKKITKDLLKDLKSLVGPFPKFYPKKFARIPVRLIHRMVEHRH